MKCLFRKTMLLFFVFLLYPLLAYSSPIDQMQNNDLGMNNFLTDNEGNVYLIQNGNLYLKSNLFGNIWGLKATNIRSASIDPINSTVMYTITKDNKFQKTLDNGKTWIMIENELFSDLNKIFINPHNNNEVFLCTSDGLLKSSDAGSSWNRMNINKSNFTYQFLIDLKSNFYTINDGGLYFSKDLGKTWIKNDNNLPKIIVKMNGRSAVKKPLNVINIMQVNSDKPYILALTRTWYSDDGGLYEIFKSENNGVSWSKSNKNFVFKVEEPTALFIDHTQKIYIGSTLGKIYESNDGLNWKTNEISYKEKFQNDESNQKEKANAIIGKALFTGERRFKNGGMPCFSCHSFGNIKSLGIESGKDAAMYYANPETNRIINDAWLNAPSEVHKSKTQLYNEKNITSDEVESLREFFRHNGMHYVEINGVYLDKKREGLFIASQKDNLIKLSTSAMLTGGSQVEETIPNDLIDTEAYSLYAGKKYASFSPDKRYLAAGTYFYPSRIFETGSLNEIAHMEHQGNIRSLAFSYNGQYFVTGDTNGIGRIYITEDWEQLDSVLLFGSDEILSIAFSPDDSFLAAGISDGTVHIYDVKTWKEIAKVKNDGGKVNAVAFSRDNRYLITGSQDRSVRVYEVSSWIKKAEIQLRGNIYSISVSPNGKFFATGEGKYNYDGVARIFEFENFKEIAKIETPGDVTFVAFSPDSKLLGLECWGQSGHLFETNGWSEILNLNSYGIAALGQQWIINNSKNGSEKLLAMDISKLSAYSLSKEFQIVDGNKAKYLLIDFQELDNLFQKNHLALESEKEEILSSLGSTRRDEFETEAEYKNRMAIKDDKVKEIKQTYENKRLSLRRERANQRMKLLDKYEVELTTLLNATRKPINNLQVSLKEYNADAEVFPLTIDDNGTAFFSSYVKVPRAVARGFRDNIAKFQVSGETVLDRTGRVKLENVEIKNPETGDTYSISTPVMNASVLTPDSF